MAKQGKPIGNLVIDLGLKDTAFRRGLQGSKQATKYWMSEMKASMKVMDLAGDKTGKLKVQHEGLTKVIESQKKELEGLKQRYKDSYDEQGNATKKTLDYAREVRNAEAKLAGFEKQLQRVDYQLDLSESKLHSSGKKFQDYGQKIDSTGQKISGFGNKVGGFGDALTNKITKPLVGAVTALSGIALFKGFERLKSIDTAKAKLKGLGHDAESIETIMDSASKSVKGTAFGLGEAATTAANATAAGIKPGKELTKYLSLTGDAAAIAGTSMSEMGSIVNKVTTGGRAMTENLEQLSDRGIPIYQWVAKEANISADEVKKFASDGKVSSEMFMKAIENNIGGAAKIMGESSFTAAIDNIWASVGRIGANFLDAGGKGGGFFSTLKPLLTDLLNNMDVLEAKAAEIGVKFGEMFVQAIDKAKEMYKWYNSLTDGQKNLIKNIGIGLVVAGPVLKFFGKFTTVIGGTISKFGKFTDTFGKGMLKASEYIVGNGGFMGSIGAMGKSIAAFATNPAVLIVGAIAAIGFAFYQAYKHIEPFRKFVDEVIQKLKEISLELYENYIKPAFDAIVAAFNEMFLAIKAFWDENGAAFIEALVNFFAVIWTILQPALGFWMGIFEATFNTIINLIKVAFGFIQGIFEATFQIIGGLIKVFTGIMTGDWQKMFDGLKDIAAGGWNLIATGVESFANAILSVIEGLAQGIQKGIVGAINGVIKAVSWVLDLFGQKGIKEWEVKELKIGRVKLPKFAKGSGGLPFDTLGVVNDQKGSNFEEMIIPRRGTPFIPKGRDVVLPMEKGTQIIPAGLTKQFKENLPHFKDGFFGNFWEGTKNTFSSIWGKVKDFSGDVWDYISNPGDLVKTAVNKFTNIPSMPSVWFDIAKGSVKTLSDNMVGYVQSLFDTHSMDSGFDGDDSIGGNGVYTYLMNIAKSLMKKYNMIFTSGFRNGDPYDHGKGLAVDIALPGVTNGSPIYKKAADEAIGMPGVKYVITNGMWKHKGQSWVKWPDGDHYDHVHISGLKPSGVPKGDGSVGQWASQIRRAAKFMGQSITDSQVNGLLKQIQRESGGNQRIIQSSAVWDENMAAGNPARGLLQYIPSTFNAFRVRGHGDILNGYHQLLAFFNNSNWRNDLQYGRSGWGPNGSRIRGYKNGGLIMREQIAKIGEGNKPEMVVPLTNESRAVQLINQAKSMLGISDGHSTIVNDNSKLESIVESLAKTVEEQGKMMIMLLKIIAEKDLNIDDNPLSKILARKNNDELAKLLYALGGTK